jgi:hypothetical protein
MKLLDILKILHKPRRNKENIKEIIRTQKDPITGDIIPWPSCEEWQSHHEKLAEDSVKEVQHLKSVIESQRLKIIELRKQARKECRSLNKGIYRLNSTIHNLTN